MKKLLFALCVCAGLCACSSDDDLVSSSSSEMPDGTVSYLKVRIKDVNSSTRAESGGYAYGTSDEYAVNNAYFYFYDDNGNYVAKGNVGTTDGTAATHDETGATPDGNIEWESETVVAVWGIADTTLPTQMLTVLNQPSDFDGTNKTLAQATAALAGTPYGESGNFVMSTSVYEGTESSGHSGEIVNVTYLTPDDFRSEPVNLDADYTDADGNSTAVDVYVERLAAKVGVSLATSAYSNDQNSGSNYYVPVGTEGASLTWDDWAKTPETITSGYYAVQLCGWNVDAIARDAYLSKQIDTSWDFTWGTSDSWNDATDSRCFWAMSPNYGVTTTTYPTSAYNATTQKYNDDEAEETSPLNEYLRYVSLKDTIVFSGTTYCGENTNTVGVLEDATSTALTDVLVKARFGIKDNNSNTFTPVDIVKYHGEYLTLADFEADMISEVIRYDFSSMVEEVADAIENSSLSSAPGVGSLMQEFVSAIEPNVYMKEKENGTTYEEFDSRFVQLINKGNGYVGIWFDTTTSVATDESSHNNHSDATDKLIPDDYNTPIVKAAAESMDNYDFYFKLNSDIIESDFSGLLTLLESFGFVSVSTSGLGITDYYLPLSDNFTINVYNANGTVNHSYTARNYLIRAIERESAGIDDDWSTAGYPNLYADGLMYYYVPIEHLGSASTDTEGNTTISEGQYGVVRNHWYNVTVTSFSDLGHGIADEAEVIVPQPEQPYYYMGADINILSWHHVTQGVNW